MAKVDPLNETEEVFSRALMRIVISLPHCLDADLVQTAGITANEYTTLMCLSEAPGRELRMTDLANASALSASRMTRLVDDLTDPRPGDETHQRRGRTRQRRPVNSGRADQAEEGLASTWTDSASASAVGALAMLPVVVWQGWETLAEAREPVDASETSAT